MVAQNPVVIVQGATGSGSFVASSEHDNGCSNSLMCGIASGLEAIASRLEAIASRLEAIASRLEAIALREAIASRLEAIALRLEATAVHKRTAVASYIDLQIVDAHVNPRKNHTAPTVHLGTCCRTERKMQVGGIPCEELLMVI